MDEVGVVLDEVWDPDRGRSLSKAGMILNTGLTPVAADALGMEESKPQMTANAAVAILAVLNRIIITHYLMRTLSFRIYDGTDQTLWMSTCWMVILRLKFVHCLPFIWGTTSEIDLILRVQLLDAA